MVQALKWFLGLCVCLLVSSCEESEKERLSRLVNLYNDDAMLHFRQEMKWKEETDYRRVCYFFAGFSIHLIAILMEETADSIYQKRHRLRKYLESSDLFHKDLYRVLLGK